MGLRSVQTQEQGSQTEEPGSSTEVLFQWSPFAFRQLGMLREDLRSTRQHRDALIGRVTELQVTMENWYLHPTVPTQMPQQVAVTHLYRALGQANDELRILRHQVHRLQELKWPGLAQGRWADKPSKQ